MRFQKLPLPPKKPDPNPPSGLTLLVVRGMHRVRCIQMRPWLAMALIGVLAVCLILTPLLFYRLAAERSHQRSQARQLAGLSRELETARQALRRSQKRAAILSAHIQELQGKTEGIEDTEPSPPPGPSPVKAPQSAQPGARPGMAIKDLRLNQDGIEWSVDFKLIHLDPKRRPVRGYVHIIALDETANPPQVWTFPKVALKEGVPLDFARGQLFVIRNYKVVRGKFFLPSAKQAPSHILALVYDEKGNLLLKRRFRVVDHMA